MKCPEGCTCGKHRRKSKPEPEVPIDHTLEVCGGGNAQDHDTTPAPAKPVAAEPEPTEPKLVYHDQSHAYYINGKRAKGVSTVSKAAGDDYNIRMWNERMIGVGLTVEPEGKNLRENIAAHLDDKQTINDICEEAKKVAKSHIKADRGTQKHRVLELVLRGKEHLLITDQQRADAEILKRTMDRYKLTPVGDLAEQFVCYTRQDLAEITGFEEPGFSLAGRFDAVLDFENAAGERVGVDLKTGENAVLYPHTTLSQLALYFNAPRISFGEQHGFNRIEVTEWTTMPDDLNRDRAYVLLVENDVKVGTLHELDISHGWRAAQLVLSINAWRKQFDEARGAVHEVPFNPLTDHRINGVSLAAQIARLQTVDQARIMWKAARAEELLTAEVREALQAKVDELKGKAVVA